MAYFDRFDICYAHQALENDWNVRGILRERPSNRRRNQSTRYQLHRIGFRSGRQGGSFNALLECHEEFQNALDIYVERLVDFGLAPLVDPFDELGTYIKKTYVDEWVDKHFPHIGATR